jgi:hypothetical protein
MVECGIATLPERQENLKRTLDSIYDQFDLIHVVLNGYNEVPDFLIDSKIRFYLMSENGGAKMKYHKVEECRGFYFSCDDDLIYPENYVKVYMDKFEKYGRRVVLTAHGGNIKANSENRALEKRNRFDQWHPKDRFIMMGGTGVMAFHQPTFNLTTEELEYNNMVDVSIFHKTQIQKFPVILIKKPENWITYQRDVIDKFNIYRQKRASGKLKKRFRDRIDIIKKPKIYEL